MNSNALQVKGQEVEVIFLDAAGTLIHLVEPVGKHYAEIARHHGLEVKSETMERAFRAVWKTQKPRPASGKTREEDDRPWWREVALQTLETAARPGPDFDKNAWFEELYDHFAQPGVWALYPDAERCLKRWRGLRLAVISNFDERLRRILWHLGVDQCFEHLIISSEVGGEKPGKEIFHAALKAMGAPAERCLHAGDDPERDWAGAAAAGMRVFRVQRPDVTLDDLSVTTGHG